MLIGSAIQAGCRGKYLAFLRWLQAYSLCTCMNLCTRGWDWFPVCLCPYTSLHFSRVQKGIYAAPVTQLLKMLVESSRLMSSVTFSSVEVWGWESHVVADETALFDKVEQWECSRAKQLIQSDEHNEAVEKGPLLSFTSDYIELDIWIGPVVSPGVIEFLFLRERLF